jgi:hypothetical protein
MTSFAFILGVLPLLIGTGAGFEMRRTLGVAVFSGMLGVTLFGIFLTPVFFNVVEWFMERPLFASERLRDVRQASYYLLIVATLGLVLVPRLVRYLRRRPLGGVVRPAGKALVANRDGHAPANGAAAGANGEGKLPAGATPPAEQSLKPVQEK